MDLRNTLTRMRNRLHQGWLWTKKISFYETAATDEYDRESGRIATRIYIASIIIFLVIFLFYTGLNDVSQTINISITDLNTYHYLTGKQPNLACPCTSIDLVQGHFIQLSPSYHPICSSDFLSNNWFAFLRSFDHGYSVNPSDWNHMTLPQFEMVKALCNLAKNTVDDALRILRQTKLLVSQISKESDFLLQAQLISNTFYTSTQNNFARSLNLSNALKQGDSLVSGLGTNFRYYFGYDNEWSYYYIYSSALVFTDINGGYCSCGLRSNCIRKVYITDSYNGSMIEIPGWFSGCYVQDSLFLSTFECYFDVSCVSFIRRSFNGPLNVQPLRVRNNSQFTSKTKVGTIVQQLFVDQWSETYNFTAYFQSCAPKSCLYVVDERRAFMIILGTLVGIWGGLTKGLDLIVPGAVKFARGHGRRWVQASLLRHNHTVHVQPKS